MDAAVFVIAFIIGVCAIMIAGFFTFNENYNHNVAFYVITSVYLSNGKIMLDSDLRCCYGHHCYETKDDKNKWFPCDIDFEPIRWRDLYFDNKHTLKKYKQLQKSFKHKK